MLKILAFLTLLVLVKHEYHVAVCEIDQQKNTLQLTQKIFIDDLEKTFEKNQHIQLLLGSKNQHPKAKQLIGDYILANTQLNISGKKAALTFLGYELENDQLFAYLESPCPIKIKSMEVKYSLLTELFSDQANLVHLNILGTKKSLYLNADSPAETVIFDK